MIPDLRDNDYYKILGCSHDSNPGELKKAYRKLAVKWHPDKNSNNKEATKVFQKISEAYNILIDKARRKEYDRKCRHNRDPSIGISRVLEKYMPKDGKNMTTQDIDNLYNAIFNINVRNSRRATHASNLPCGTTVYLLGIHSSPKYNGLRGQVLQCNPITGMYLVQLIDSPNTFLHLNPSNLSVMTAM
mmetsp:Transcript_34309/g.39068  ORF Transcript_34309/g.39068 Transcript_34309/m.39068 type:complete len:188 (+) Transcript_34309:181-744(+)